MPALKINPMSVMNIVKHCLRYLLPVAAGLSLTTCNPTAKPIENTVTFNARLSEYGLFKSMNAGLVPQTGVQTMEIASPLFTDYAEKQRLLKLPDGKRVSLNGNGLPRFPDGTILAKTFYYSKTKTGKRQITETRLLILERKKWSAATYRWNAEQTEAHLLKDGAVVPVSLLDNSGHVRHIEYRIPSQNDCSSCHRSGDELRPIGPTARNLNVTVNAEGKSRSQLTYLMDRGLFAKSAIDAIHSLPDYQDTSVALPFRARAYLEMNCAHCHQPGGIAAGTSLNLSYPVRYKETGIDFNKQNIIIRMSTMGEYHMPKIGTTIVDDEGVRLVKDYIHSLDSPTR
jgi:uncharacterized repeat protein (TIGR03806 family)